MAPGNEVDFNGKWKLCDSENFEGFLEKMGINWMIRKLALKAKPECTIERKGDHWRISTKTGFFTRESEFNIGEEFDSEDASSTKTKSTAAFDGEKLTIKSNPAEGQKGFYEIATREITEDGRLVLTMDVDPEGERVVCKRIFKKEN